MWIWIPRVLINLSCLSCLVYPNKAKKADVRADTIHPRKAERKQEKKEKRQPKPGIRREGKGEERAVVMEEVEVDGFFRSSPGACDCCCGGFVWLG